MVYNIRWVDKTEKKEKLHTDSYTDNHTLKLIKIIMESMQKSNKIIITKK